MQLYQHSLEATEEYICLSINEVGPVMVIACAVISADIILLAYAVVE